MNKKIGLKDIVLITLLTAIMIGIQTVVLMPFITNLKFVIWFVGGIDGVLCGIIYCLMIAKAPKLGTAFIFSFIFAVYYFFVNSMIIISAMIAGAGLVMELILWNNGYCICTVRFDDNAGSQCAYFFAKRCDDCRITGKWIDTRIY